MTLDDFREDLGGSPLSIEDFAEAASDVDGDIDLRAAARTLLHAIRSFKGELYRVGVVIG